MPEPARIGLDNPVFQGRLRQPTQSLASQRPVARRSYVNDIVASLGRPPVSAQRIMATAPAPASAPNSVVLRQPNPVPMPPAVAAVQPAPATTEPNVVASLARDVATPAIWARAKTALEQRSRAQLTILGMAVVIFLIGIFVSALTLQTNQSAKSQVAALSEKTDQQGDGSNNSGATPSESRPSGSAASYQVAPDLPKLLKISKLGVSARIKPLSVTNQNVMQAPTNIYDTGWYNASAKPGDPAGNGAVLIDGHVHGPTLPGVFMNIKKLVPGDTIQVVRGDNKTFTYVVVKTQNYDAASINMAMALTSIKPGQAGLNLMTCGGPYDKVSGEYTQRTVVFAVQQI